MILSKMISCRKLGKSGLSLKEFTTMIHRISKVHSIRDNTMLSKLDPKFEDKIINLYKFELIFKFLYKFYIIL
jgi:hypothetical protein